MAEIAEVSVTVDTVGGAGVATGNGTSQAIHGFLESIFVDYHVSAPATTDVTIAFANQGGNIVVISNNATDGLYAPAKQVCDATGAGVAGVYINHVVNQPLTVSVAQCNALTGAVTVTFRYMKV